MCNGPGSLSLLRNSMKLYVLVALLATLAVLITATPLDDYVNKPDSTYKWQFVSSEEGNEYTVYYINMTSQTWLTPEDSSASVWFHWVSVCIPKQLSGFNTANLFINGGSNDGSFESQKTIDPLVAMLCATSGMVTANIGQIPNQPVVFASDPNHERRSEDAMVAYTWAHFLNDTSSPEWLARLPMTKACVRAMDTVQAFISTMKTVPAIQDFAVMGGSKRGWTTWTTAAVDSRVKLFIPIVIPVLDLQNALNRLFEPYGQWSFVLSDYINTGVMPKLNSPEFAELAAIVDPLVYNNRFAKRPHYIVCGSMDEFFLPDSANLFWDRLVGPKLLRIVPNADHALIGQQFEVVESVNTFIQLVLRNEPVPNFTWKMQYSNVSASIIASIPPNQPGSGKLVQVNLWQANTVSPNLRDFRLITCKDVKCLNPAFWTSEKLTDVDGKGTFVATRQNPGWGWRAFLIEAVFAYPWTNLPLNASREIRMTTEVNVVPSVMPFPPCYATNKC